jgi:hypothetical protein
MRPTITCLLVLVIASMLVGTAFAECVAMNMPCCAQHQSPNCHEICAAPIGNVNNATAPQFAYDLRTVATVRPVLAIPQIVPTKLQPTFAPSAENLLMRIQVLLL